MGPDSDTGFSECKQSRCAGGQVLRGNYVLKPCWTWGGSEIQVTSPRDPQSGGSLQSWLWNFWSRVPFTFRSVLQTSVGLPAWYTYPPLLPSTPYSNRGVTFLLKKILVDSHCTHNKIQNFFHNRQGRICVWSVSVILGWPRFTSPCADPSLACWFLQRTKLFILPEYSRAWYCLCPEHSPLHSVYSKHLLILQMSGCLLPVTQATAGLPY